MNPYATEHILRRCIQLLKRPNGTTRVKQEYHYWIDWLNKEFSNFHKKNNTENINNFFKEYPKIIQLINSNQSLKDDIKL